MGCPTPAKKAYPSDAAARRAAAVQTHDQRLGRRDVYPCPDGGHFHLTSGSSLSSRIRNALKESS